MRISVDPDRCVGGGQCVLTAEDLFDQDDDGIVTLLEDSPGDDRLDDARTAAQLCPAGAIEVTAAEGAEGAAGAGGAGG